MSSKIAQLNIATLKPYYIAPDNSVLRIENHVEINSPTHDT